MVVHVVLFRPAPDLTPDARASLATALERALVEIPQIRGARVGSRLRLGRAYDDGAAGYEYVLLLEFDSVEDLRAYLDHPAHAELGRHFSASSALAHAYDFQVIRATGGAGSSA